MIIAYLAGIPSPYEGEDIEIRFCIYEDQELMDRKSILLEYKKPALVGLFALNTLLKELKRQMRKKIVIIVNDAALNELIRGTSTIKNTDVQDMASRMRKELLKYENTVIKDVSSIHAELVKWNEILKP